MKTETIYRINLLSGLFNAVERITWENGSTGVFILLECSDHCNDIGYSEEIDDSPESIDAAIREITNW